MPVYRIFPIDEFGMIAGPGTNAEFPDDTSALAAFADELAAGDVEVWLGWRQVKAGRQPAKPLLADNETVFRLVSSRRD